MASFDTSNDAPDPVSMQDPNLVKINQAGAAMHMEENAPLVQAVTKIADPKATPDDRLKAGAIVKNYAGTDEMRLPDFIASVMTLNIPAAIVSATGGANVYKRAFDQNGNNYQAIYNQRGELRGYQTNDGKRLSDEDLKGKFIAIPEDLPLSQRAGFVQQNMSAKTIGEATAKQWAADQDTAGTAASNSIGLLDATDHLRAITPQLAPLSVNPATRSLIAGIGSIGYGNRSAVEDIKTNATDVYNGTAKQKEGQKTVDKMASLGIKGIAGYQEGKGAVDKEGNVIDWHKLDNELTKKASEKSSYDQIQTNQRQLLEQAQILAAQGKLQNLDLIKDAINTQAKAQGHIANIQATNGGKGLGFAQPNPDFNLGDSFSSLAVANEANNHYAKLAKLFADKVFTKQKEVGPYGAAPIGSVQNDIRNDPLLGTLKSERDSNLQQLQKILSQYSKKVNSGVVDQAIAGVKPPDKPVQTSKVANSAPPDVGFASSNGKPVTFGTTSFGGVKTPDDVKKLFKQGTINRESARAMLQDMDSKGVMQ